MLVATFVGSPACMVGSTVGVTAGGCVASATTVGTTVAAGSVDAGVEFAVSAPQAAKAARSTREASNLVSSFLMYLFGGCMRIANFSYPVRLDAILPKGARP